MNTNLLSVSFGSSVEVGGLDPVSTSLLDKDLSGKYSKLSKDSALVRT